MATAADAVRIDGMKDFLESMKQLKVEVPTRVIRVALNEAADLVVVNARGRAPRRSGRLQSSIRASSTGSSARVSEGGARVPYAGFIDYGGTVGRARYKRRGKGVHVRPFIKTGRILYPAFEAVKVDVAKQMDQSLTDAIHAVRLRTDY